MNELNEKIQRDVNSILVLKIENKVYLTDVLQLLKNHGFRIPPEAKILEDDYCYLWINANGDDKTVFMYVNPDEFDQEGDDKYFLRYPRNALKLTNFLEYRTFD